MAEKAAPSNLRLRVRMDAKGVVRNWPWHCDRKQVSNHQASVGGTGLSRSELRRPIFPLGGPPLSRAWDKCFVKILSVKKWAYPRAITRAVYGRTSHRPLSTVWAGLIRAAGELAFVSTPGGHTVELERAFGAPITPVWLHVARVITGNHRAVTGALADVATVHGCHLALLFCGGHGCLSLFSVVQCGE